MSRTDLIVTSVIQQVQSGELRPGERIASIRAGAVLYGVSKNTVAEAYDRLVAMGHLEARPGSGYYVATRRQIPPIQRSREVARAVDTVSLLREQLVRDYEVRIGDGRPPEAWMEKFDLRRAGQLPSLETDREIVHGYGNPWGFKSLRNRIALMLDERGIAAGADNVLLTNGANHALDLVARQLLQPGDVALVDSPGYYPLFGKLQFSRVTMVGVRRNADGPDVQDLEAKVIQHKPKVFFTQSFAHNPTGGTLALPVGHRVLKIADQHDFYVVEDDPFADILPPDRARLAMLDQLERVIYIGTFSKTLSASLRVGYLAASLSLTRALCDLKMLTLVSTSDFSERLVLGLIDSGQYLRHLRRLRTHVEQATKDALRTLKSLGLHTPYGADGGFYVWACLPGAEDETALTAAAAQKSIFLAPGQLFFPSRNAVATPPALRINIAYARDPRFVAFMRDRVATIRRTGPHPGSEHGPVQKADPTGD